MEVPNKKWLMKENPILKTWKKIKSFGRKSKKSKNPETLMTQQNKKNKIRDEENANPDNVCSYPPSSPSSSNIQFSKSLSCPCSPQIAPTKHKNKQKVLAPQGCFTVYVGPEKQRFVVRAKMVNHPLFQELLEEAEEKIGYQREGPIVLPCQVSFFFRTLAEIETRDDDSDFPNCHVCGLFSPRRSSSYKLLSAPPTFKLNEF